MGTRPPINKERDETVRDDRGRVGKLPAKCNSVWADSRAGTQRPKRYSVVRCIGNKRAERDSLYSPCHQAGTLNVVDSKPTGSTGLGLPRVWRNYFEVRHRAERKERVACASARVLATRGGSHTQTTLEVIESMLHIVNCVDQMVHLAQQRIGNGQIMRLP